MSTMVPMYGFGGSGGGGLNFKVVGCTTQPTNPTENTIWVNTSVSITDWVFSATEPTDPKDGMVWITTGTHSTVAFNALKKNGIQIYPISAKQYISSAWVNVTAMSYQDGVWAEWFEYLYNAGNEYTELTGGWVAAAKATSSDNTSKITPTITRGGSSITFKNTGSSGAGGIVYLKNKISLNGKKTIRAYANVSGSHNQWSNIYFCVWSVLGTYWYDNIAGKYAVPPNGDGSYETEPMQIDISLLPGGEYYIGFGTSGFSAYKPSIELKKLTIS